MTKCKICNYEIGELPVCFGSGSPALSMVPEDERANRVAENAV